MKGGWLLMIVAACLVMPGVRGAPAGEPADYRFAPGDVIEITVTPQKDFSRIVTVQPDGKISYPLVGQLRVAELTGEQLAEKLRQGLGQELNDPQVTVSLKELNRQAVQRVSLLGAVRSPGVLEIKDGTTVAELLASGGGPTPLADLRRVTVTRPDHAVITVDLAETDRTGRIPQNVVLQAGDIVVVPEGVRPTVLVLGEVQKPGSYEIPREARLLDAVSLAGGLTEKADLHRVTLGRAGSTPQQTLDLQPLLAQGDTSDPTLNLLLQPGDTIFVAETVQQVYVLGRVVKPNTYQIKPTDRLLDALVMAGGAAGDGDLSKTVLVRRDANGQPVARTLDLKKMMAKGKLTENELLRPGDVLFVPDRKARRPLSEFTSIFWPLNTLLNLLR
jgi:polysaccharide export outer membrane protein